MREKTQKSKGFLIAAVVGAVLAVVGMGFWIAQMNGGMIQTGMRNLDSWGLYITNFMFFVGLSAGGLIISSVPNAFGLRGFGGISKVAIWTSICCTVAAIGFVVVDLGQPARLWELFIYSNFGSPLMWDIVVLSVYLILSIVYLVAHMRFESGKITHVALRTLSFAALIVAVLVHSVTAWIFGLQQAHEFWHTALLAPWFVSSALVCGTALVLVVSIILRKIDYLEVERESVEKMAKVLAISVCVDLYIFACDLLTSGFPGSSGAEIVETLIVGPLAPFFWFEVIGCIVAVVICVIPKLRTDAFLSCAAVLAIVGIFCKRVQLLVGGFQLPNIDFANMADAYSVTKYGGGVHLAYEGLVYWPTGIEWAVCFGVIGLAFALLCFGLARIDLKPRRSSADRPGAAR